ncbi:MAG TPA: hypothetical protein VGC30_04170 [Dokdonella sp.]
MSLFEHQARARRLRAHQLAQIGARYDDGTRALVEVLVEASAGLHPMQRLPLAALAFPALRRRPRPQLTTFRIALRELIDADGRVTLAEYCLARLINVQVLGTPDPARTPPAGASKLIEVEHDVRDVLAVLAAHGHADVEAARRAYALGLLEALPAATIAYAPPSSWVDALDRALPRLDRLAPAGEELPVRALTRAVAADGALCAAEAELLRAIAPHCTARCRRSALRPARFRCRKDCLRDPDDVYEGLRRNRRAGPAAFRRGRHVQRLQSP